MEIFLTNNAWWILILTGVILLMALSYLIGNKRK